MIYIQVYEAFSTRTADRVSRLFFIFNCLQRDYIRLVAEIIK